MFFFGLLSLHFCFNSLIFIDKGLVSGICQVSFGHIVKGRVASLPEILIMGNWHIIDLSFLFLRKSASLRASFLLTGSKPFGNLTVIFVKLVSIVQIGLAKTPNFL